MHLGALDLLDLPTSQIRSHDTGTHVCLESPDYLGGAWNGIPKDEKVDVGQVVAMGNRYGGLKVLGRRHGEIVAEP
jgi:hypothetical protein